MTSVCVRMCVICMQTVKYCPPPTPPTQTCAGAMLKTKVTSCYHIIIHVRVYV